MSDMGFGGRFSDGHWTNGGTGVTNFTEDRRAVYVEAVRRYGDTALWVEEKSFGEGNENYGGSLHCNHRGDLGDFWRVFDTVKKEMARGS